MSAHRSVASRHRSATSRRHGVSNAHAFAVGRATGVNINGSHMGAHGAALHRSAERRKRRSHMSSSRGTNSKFHTIGQGGTMGVPVTTNTNGLKTALGIMGGMFLIFTVMSIIIFLLFIFFVFSVILPYFN